MCSKKSKSERISELETEVSQLREMVKKLDGKLTSHALHPYPYYYPVTYPYTVYTTYPYTVSASPHTSVTWEGTI